MDATTQITAVANLKALFFDPYNVLLFVFLFAVGRAFKWLKFPDYTILFTVWAMGISVGIALMTYTFKQSPWVVSLILGTVDAVAAVFSYQILKQLFESPLGKVLVKFPMVTWVALLSGVTVDPQEPSVPKQDDQKSPVS
jgi:hypothetical protein